MILKDSFRMQNYLTDLMQQMIVFLSKTDHVMKTRKIHQYSKGMPEKEDVSMIVRESEMRSGNMMELLLDVLEEKEKLALAINRAKASALEDIDVSLASNKARQEVIRRFRALAQLKSSESEEMERDYYITPTGVQDAYMYPLKTIRTIDFDRNRVKGIIKRLQKESDAVSSRIDLLNLTLEVDHEPKYELGESLEDVYEKFYGNEETSSTV